MTVPSVAALRFLWGCALGVALGIYYDFLQPLGSRHRTLADLLFLPGAAWAWLELMFRICRGDIRVSASLALILGMVLWELSFGGFSRHFFARFWGIFIGLIDIFLLPCKKF
ncbi:MAG: hypothetical protein IKY96_01985 [Oscillospiraceae bacterium]|nr:hypothetical protein [Oscillospiraceae bacterium]